MKYSPPLARGLHPAGFTIIELAIVLTVVAMIAGGALAIGASRLEASKINATDERLNFLMDALDVYVKQYCSLPCPASPSVAPSDQYFGIGQTPQNPGDPHDCISTSLVVEGTTHVVAGAVPARTMRISPALMLDGWGRKFMYVVDKDLTLKGDGATPGFSNPSVKGEIVVRSSPTSADVTNEGAVLILSYGTNGHGAWRAKGGGRLDKDTTDVSEKANSWDGDGVSGDGAFDNIFVQKFNTSTYDDIVQYKTKWQLPDSPNCAN